MSTETKDFIDEYLKWIKNNSYQRTIGDFEEITTPFIDSHNDQIQFYIKKEENGYLLTDDGYTISDLEMCGCDIKSKKRKEMISQISESIGVQVVDNALITHATQFDVPRKQHIMIQAILKISDMFLTSSSRIRSLFFEEVESFFAEKDIRNTPSIMMMGQSGLSHRFDFVIPASRKMPERVVTTLNSPSKQSVQASIFAWNDIAKTRNNESRGYIILNDTKHAINSDLTSAITSYDLIPLPWKEREKFIDELVS